MEVTNNPKTFCLKAYMDLQESFHCLNELYKKYFDLDQTNLKTMLLLDSQLAQCLSKNHWLEYENIVADLILHCEFIFHEFLAENSATKEVYARSIYIENSHDSKQFSRCFYLVKNIVTALVHSENLSFLSDDFLNKCDHTWGVLFDFDFKILSNIKSNPFYFKHPNRIDSLTYQKLPKNKGIYIITMMKKELSTDNNFGTLSRGLAGSNWLKYFYVGQSTNLYKRFKNHHKLNEAIAFGHYNKCTPLLWHTTEIIDYSLDEFERKAIDYYKPLANNDSTTISNCRKMYRSLTDI